MLTTVKGTSSNLKRFSQDKNVFQKVFVTLHRQSKCSRDSTSSLQKAQSGESIILNLKSLSFVNTILFSILYWNSLDFMS